MSQKCIQIYLAIYFNVMHTCSITPNLEKLKNEYGIMYPVQSF